MIVGTAGHIDHGKSTLVRALTGVDPDRLEEEKKRGITLDLGYAYLPLGDGRVLGFVDVPGHERLVHNMLAGATGIDLALLVVAADDGPMPQTREHLAILELLGLERGVVVITKIDRVERSRLREAEAEIDALLRGSFLSGAPRFLVSAVSGEGIPSLLAWLTAQAEVARSTGRLFRLAVDRVFTLAGVGTVVTGTAFAGSVQIGDNLVVSPAGHTVRVRGLHVQNRPAEFGQAGQRCALNLVGPLADRAHIRRGDWIVAPAAHHPTGRIDVRLRLLPTETRSLTQWTPVHFHLGTQDVLARVVLLESDKLEAGESQLAQLVTERPIGAAWGDRFILRDASAHRTLGGGVVLDIFAPSRRRRRPERLSWLRALEGDNLALVLRRLLAAAPLGIDLAAAAANFNLPEEKVLTMLEDMPLRFVPASRRVFASAVWATLETQVLSRLGRLHEEVPDELGPDRDRLRRLALPALDAGSARAIIDGLLAQGRLVASGHWLHLPGHAVRLSPMEEALWQRISPRLDATPFQPPRVRDLARQFNLDEKRVRTLLMRVARTGAIWRVAHDHYFSAQAIAHLAGFVTELTRIHGAVHAAAFRDHIGTGRKLAIQILEFFDRIGYTRRVGDAHILRDITVLEGIRSPVGRPDFKSG